MEEERRRPAGEDDRHGGPPLPAVTELIGASKIGPRGYGLTNRKHGDDAGAMTTSPVPFSQPGRNPRSACHCRREESLPARVKTGPTALVRCGNCMGRKRMTRGLTIDENRGGGRC
jgi:hypothetical protein